MAQDGDNRDIFDKALDAGRGAAIGGGVAGATFLMGSRLARRFGTKLKRGKLHLAGAATLGGAAGATVSYGGGLRRKGGRK